MAPKQSTNQTKQPTNQPSKQTNKSPQNVKQDDNDAPVKQGSKPKDILPTLCSKFFKNGEYLDSDSKKHNKNNIEKHQIAGLFPKETLSIISLPPGVRHWSVSSGEWMLEVANPVILKQWEKGAEKK